MDKYLKDNACIIGFNDFWLRVIGIPVVGLIFPFLFFSINPFETPKKYLIYILISVINTAMYWHIDRGIIIYFRKKLTKASQYKKRVILQSAVILIITLLLCLLIDYLLNSSLTQFIDQDFKSPFFLTTLASLVVTFLITSIYETMYAFELYKIGLVQNEVLKKENTEAQLQTLKNQVNPHFLFNSLNTLTSLIPENPKTAVKFVENLSKVYRYILEIKEKNIITLGEEMKCYEAYEFLLKIRFGENIHFVKTGFNGNKNKFIVPLSIQLLIENAVKHNVISKASPLTISLEASEDYIRVKNNLQHKKQIAVSTKTGLKNIQKRYELLQESKIEITETETYFQVKLPLINIKQAL